MLINASVQAQIPIPQILLCILVSCFALMQPLWFVMSGSKNYSVVPNVSGGKHTTFS